MGWMVFHVFAVICVATVLFLIALILFEPGLDYCINPRPVPIDSDEFLELLGALCDAEVRGCGPIDVLKNGEQFFAAELKAIAEAKESIHLEAYIFHRGRVTEDFVKALAERAKNG